MSVQGLHQPVTAGVVTALVGFTSSFAVVLAGLRSVGATPEQAASGLLAVTVGFGVLMFALATWTRIPVTLAWSTPGAALLVSAGTVEGGWPAAVGAFVLTGVLLALTGAVPALGRLIARIPGHVAQAMLGGVLLGLCLEPVTATADHPWIVLPVVGTWLVATRWLPRWAVPLALVVALVGIGVDLARRGESLDWSAAAPSLSWTTPSLSVAAVVGIALPLTIVTVTSQNVPGVAVLRSFGYEAPWTKAVVASGVGTAVTAPFGGFAINLAAISASLSAGDEAGPRERRWVAAATAGVVATAIGVASGVFVVLTSAAPTGVIATVAGLALVPTFAAAVSSSLTDPVHRLSAAVTFLVAASGLTIAGVSGAFWALVAGLAVHLLLERRSRA